jgi:hypothetical protein
VENGYLENGYISRNYMKMSSDDRRTFDRWLKANAIIGLICAVGIIAMAVAGSNSGGSRDAAVAENNKTSDVVASEKRRLRAAVPNVQHRHE